MLGRRVGWEPLLPDYQPLHRAVVRTHSLLPPAEPMPWLPLTKEALTGGKQPAELVPDSDVELDAAGRALLGERESPTRPLPCCVRARIVSLNGAWLRLNR